MLLQRQNIMSLSDSKESSEASMEVGISLVLRVSEPWHVRSDVGSGAGLTTVVTLKSVPLKLTFLQCVFVRRVRAILIYLTCFY